MIPLQPLRNDLNILDSYSHLRISTEPLFSNLFKIKETVDSKKEFLSIDGVRKRMVWRFHSKYYN
jgi:hypothetical protein